MDWVPEEFNWSGCRDTPTDLSEEHCATLTDVDGDPQFPQVPLKVAGIYLHRVNRPALQW